MLEFVIAWLVLMVPIIVSPGPTNVILAVIGARHGFFGSLRFIFGVNAILLVIALVVGAGFGQVLSDRPEILRWMQILGAVYVLYLSYKFLKDALKPDALKFEADDTRATIFSGAVIQALNPKVWTMVVLMFSLFANQVSSFGGFMIVLAVMLVVLNTLSNFLWVGASSWLAAHLESPSVVRMQNYVFGIALGFVAVWLLVS